MSASFRPAGLFPPYSVRINILQPGYQFEFGLTLILEALESSLPVR